MRHVLVVSPRQKGTSAVGKRQASSCQSLVRNTTSISRWAGGRLPGGPTTSARDRSCLSQLAIICSKYIEVPYMHARNGCLIPVNALKGRHGARTYVPSPSHDSGMSP